MEQIQQFEYNGELVKFEIKSNQVMVNATEMAKIFEKDVPDFLMLKQTKEFIGACLNNQNSGYLNFDKEENIYTTRQKSGTWMHRILALKFAAWLDPSFELWVYSTIDNILFGYAKRIETELHEIARFEIQKEEVDKRLEENEDFLTSKELDNKIKRARAKIAKANKEQTELFKN